jgi:hypothetical protein
MTVELPDSPADREETYLATIAGETGVELPEENKVNPTSIMQSVKIGCRSNGYHWEYVKRAFRKALV